MLSYYAGIAFRVAIASFAALLLAAGCNRDGSSARSDEVAAKQTPSPESEKDQSPTEAVSLRVLGMT